MWEELAYIISRMNGSGGALFIIRFRGVVPFRGTALFVIAD